MRTVVLAALCSLLCVSGVGATESAKKKDVVGELLAKPSRLHMRVGLGEGMVSWGLDVLHFTQTPDFDSSQAFGLFGKIASPSLGLLEPGQLPPFWKGLNLEGFVDLNIDYDPDKDQVIIEPGAGLTVEPTQTMSFIVRGGYPVTPDDRGGGQINFNSLIWELGLCLRF